MRRIFLIILKNHLLPSLFCGVGVLSPFLTSCFTAGMNSGALRLNLIPVNSGRKFI